MPKTTPIRFLTAIAAICVSGTGLTLHATSSPNLDKALDALKAAQRAEDGGAEGDPNDPTVAAATPAPQQTVEATAKLQEALKWLKRATNEKGGMKDNATTAVNNALDLVKSGDKAGADKAMREAMDDIFAASHHRGGWSQ